MQNIGQFSQQFAKIISQAISKKMYGSIEIYFEAGRVTQVTQRIINKIRTKIPGENVQFKTEVKSSHGNGKDQDIKGRNTLLTSQA